MLEFNEQHKSADLSPIKSKLDKAKHIGKATVCGILIASTLLFSGCGTIDKSRVYSDVTETAIVLHDDTAMIIDLADHYSYGSTAQNVTLKTTTGEEIIISVENVHIVESENSREIAEKMAKNLLGEKGTITYYDDVVENVKTK